MALCTCCHHNVTYYLDHHQLSQAASETPPRPKPVLVVNLFWGSAGSMKADKADFGQYPVQVHWILLQLLGIYVFAARAFNLLC